MKAGPSGDGVFWGPFLGHFGGTAPETVSAGCQSDRGCPRAAKNSPSWIVSGTALKTSVGGWLDRA